jgi:hypothetical protein
MSILRQTLNGSHLVAIGEDRQRQARTDGIAIQKDGAGAAYANAAAFLGAGESKVVAKEVEQETVIGNLSLDRFAVHPKANRFH